MPKTEWTPEQLAMIEKNMLEGMEATKGGREAFGRWFRQKFAREIQNYNDDLPVMIENDADP